MIHSVYVLTEGGVLLYRRVYSDEMPNPFIVSSFVSAISSFSQQAMGDNLKRIDIDGSCMLLFEQNPIKVLVLTDESTDAGSNLLEEIAVNFISRYSKAISSGNHNSDSFNDFDAVLEELISEMTNAWDSSRPTHSLDGLSFLELEPSIQKMAQYVLRRDEVTAQEAAEELEIKLDEAERQLEHLVDLGMIGWKRGKRERMYYS